MAQGSARWKPGLFLDASASHEYVHQQSPAGSSGFTSRSSRSEDSSDCESGDDSDGDDRPRDSGRPNGSSSLTATDIAQRALRELDDLFADMYDNQRARSDSQSVRGGSDVESSDGGQEEIGISLEEMTIALNAAIERHRPAPNKEKSKQQSHRKRLGVVKADVIDCSAPALPQDVVLPIAHFQDVLQQRIKCFQASKQGKLSPISTSDEDPMSPQRQPQWERQRRRHRTDCPRPPPTQPNALSFDGSRSSVSARSEVSISDSECAKSHISSKNPLPATKRVEMPDQKQQTSQMCMSNQATETRDLFDDPLPRSQQQGQPDSTTEAVLHQPSSVEVCVRRCSERVPPSDPSTESSRPGPMLADLVSGHASRRDGMAARWADELSSSKSSRSSLLSRSSLSSASSVSSTPKHQSHSSSRTSSHKFKRAPRPQSHSRYPASQQPTEPNRPMKPTASKSERYSNAFDRVEDCAEKQVYSPLWELDLSNFNP